MNWSGRVPRIQGRAGVLFGVVLVWAWGAGGLAAQGSAGAGKAAPAAATRPVPTCERCHGELEFQRQHAATLAQAEARVVSDRALRGTGHDLPCQRCHQGFDGYPHLASATRTATCAACHPEVAAKWKAGAHAQVDRGSPVDCQDCHGIHAVPKRSAFRNPATVAVMNGRCLSCHSTKAFSPHAPHADGVACAACHGAHDIHAPDRPGSTLAAAAQYATCGACHSREAASARNDVHGRLVLNPPSGGRTTAPAAPACTTCHGGHGMLDPKQATSDVGPDAACVRCHEKYADTFADSYHGQASHLGSKRVAGCAGCHTAHAILPASNPRSSVAKANLVRTCGRCHLHATASFTAFRPHADVHDRAKNPLLFWTYRFMTLLLMGTLAVFGLHTALWLARSGLDAWRADRRAHSAGPGSGGQP